MVASPLSPTLHARRGVTLGISGDAFTLNSSPTFLTFVSYFDALDASDPELQRDLQMLRAFGVDGIRVFAMWHDSPSVLDSSGDIDEGVFSALTHILDVADDMFMVVDISFDMEVPDPDISYGDFKDGLSDLADRLSGYNNIMFDVANEANLNALSPSDVHELCDSVHMGDAGRICFASIAEHADFEAVGDWGDNSYSDVLAWHNDRGADWWDNVGDDTAAVVGETTKPLYLQEPGSYDDAAFSAADIRGAVAAAEGNGAAAFCFHTLASFDLGDFVGALNDDEYEFLATYKWGADDHWWGGVIGLETYNGHFISIDGGGPQGRADETEINGASAFGMYIHDTHGLYDGDYVSFWWFDNWLQAEDGGGSGKTLLTDGSGHNSWETFRIRNVTRCPSGWCGKPIRPGDQVALLSDAGYWVCAENGGGNVVNVDRTSIGTWETFVLHLPWF